jgi:hypothetical protein
MDRRVEFVNKTVDATCVIVDCPARGDGDGPAKSKQSDRRQFRRITYRQASLTTFYGPKQEDLPLKKKSKESH